MKGLSLWQQFWYYLGHNGTYVLQQFNHHFAISVYGVLLAALVGIPLGILISRHHHLNGPIISIANIIQTIPSLAMVSMLMLVLGLGDQTVIVANFLYSLLPIIKNTAAGLDSVSPVSLDAGRGLGMTKWQLLVMVEMPLSVSVIMAGIRNALVVAIGITAIGSFVGAGGLGDIIIRGTNATNGGAIILAGALPTALMAIITDWILGWVQHKLAPHTAKKAQ